MPKLAFKGNPPMMDFTLVKLTGGQNMIDNKSRGIYSLGEGELTKIITEAGQALRRSIEATLANMKPNQMIRCQILMHGNVGYAFLAPHSFGAPTFGDKVQFAFGGDDNDDNNNIIVARGRNKGNNYPGVEEVKNFVVVADDNSSIIDCSPEVGNIKHATPGDNTEGDDIIQAD